MLWNELLRNGEVSLLVSKNDTQYCVCHNYDPKAEEDRQYNWGTYFCYFDDKKLKAEKLSEAVDRFRSLTEPDYISRARLEELATNFKDGLFGCALEQEEYNEFFLKECDMEENELSFFGIETESEVEDYE